MVDSDTDVLLLDEALDEFLVRMLEEYEGLSFKSIAEVDSEEEKTEEESDIIESLKSYLPDEVVDLNFTDKLKDVPSMIKQRGEVSIEMEKALKNQPQAMGIKAEKVLEINKNSKAYELLEDAYKNDKDKAREIVNLLLDQSKLMEGLEIDDPVTYTKNIWKLI